MHGSSTPTLPTCTHVIKPLPVLDCLANKIEQEREMHHEAEVIRGCVKCLRVDEEDREILLWAAGVAEKRAERLENMPSSLRYTNMAKRLRELANR